jgi:hypothetical protein
MTEAPPTEGVLPGGGRPGPRLPFTAGQHGAIITLGPGFRGPTSEVFRVDRRH